MTAKVKLCGRFLFPDDDDDDTTCELPAGHPGYPKTCAAQFEEQLHEACTCGEDPDQEEDRNCPAHRLGCECCGFCVGIPCALPEYTCPAYCGHPGEPGHFEEAGGRRVVDGTLERCPLCNAAPSVPCREGCPRGWFPAAAEAPASAEAGAP